MTDKEKKIFYDYLEMWREKEKSAFLQEEREEALAIVDVLEELEKKLKQDDPVTIED